MRKLLTVLTSLFILSASAGVVDVYNDGVFDGIDTVLDIYDGGKFNPPENGGSPVDPDLVLWYQFLDDTTPTPDSTSNNNDGVVDGASWGSETNAGQVIYYYSFDGVNDNIESQSNSGVGAINPRTISLWVRRDSTNANQVIWSTGAQSANNQYQLFYSANTRNISLGINGSTATWNDVIADDTEWHLVTIVSELNGQLDETTLYINGASEGVPDSATGGSNIPNTTASPIFLGQTITGGAPWDGLLSDFRIYNTNLSASAVDDIYTSTASGYGASTEPTDLRVWYEFNTNTTPTPDSSRYGNDGIVNGATWNTNMWYDFDGVNDDINPPQFWSSQPTEYTAMIWVKPNTLSQEGSLFAYDNDNMFVYARMNANTNGNLRLHNDSNDGGDVEDYWQGDVFSTNEWTHITIKAVESLYWNGYVNGSLVVSNSMAGDFMSVGSANQYIGTSRTAGNRFVDGSLDGFRGYTRALTDSEITEIYNETLKD